MRASSKSIGLERKKSASVAEGKRGDELWIVSNGATTRMTPATECVFDCVKCNPRITRAAGDNGSAPQRVLARIAPCHEQVTCTAVSVAAKCEAVRDGEGQKKCR